MTILEEQLREKRMYAEANLRDARRFKRFITVTSIGVEELELGGTQVECLKVYFDGIYGYIPKDKMDDYEFRSLFSFVDGEFQVNVEEVISDDNNSFFIGNRKAALEKQAEMFWDTAKVGQVHDAFVSGVDKANVYLIISGVRIRMSKEEYSYTYHRDLREVIARGEHIDVQINTLNVEDKKLKVSRRVLEADPKTFLSEYKAGGIYAAEVNNINTEVGGVFVTLKPRGISALAQFPSMRVGQHIKEGQKVQFKVSRVDLQTGHIYGHVVIPRVQQIGKAHRS
ncbi:hypothetical protein LAV73_09025 [Lysinibacillus xylanilyticus]|uniref:hypothetical protein n=1 Tax=Lysinibacillus xylanilyticus TaxID=582475 RepID=UPI002B240542|nr:hypothetical protein [Lysinibacillus xylanilyticus]MEB2280137.1 hypothetical protein [Lysinibacillus xylanilyticus]